MNTTGIHDLMAYDEAYWYLSQIYDRVPLNYTIELLYLLMRYSYSLKSEDVIYYI